MQAIFQPYFLKTINVERRFKMLLSQNENQVFRENHQSQEKTFRGAWGALDWFPRPLWSHLPRCCGSLISFTWVELPFHFMQEENTWEKSGCTVWKAPVRVARQGAVVPCQIEDLANDHRTAKRAFDVCTPLEKLTQALSEVVQMQQIKSGVCIWSFPQPQEPHSTCVSKAFKFQTLILLRVTAQHPPGSTQSHPAVVLHSSSAPLGGLAIIQWLPAFFLFTRSRKTR